MTVPKDYFYVSDVDGRDYLVHLLAFESVKGGQFTGRHRLARAAHSLENPYYCLFHKRYILFDIVVSVLCSDVPE